MRAGKVALTLVEQELGPPDLHDGERGLCVR